MFLSIVIPVYNSRKYLSRCLDSIWSQHLPDGDYEIICVDDCSTDGSQDFIASQTADHPVLALIRHQKNLRAGGARNTGVKNARGEYVVFIDSDDYFHPGSLLFAYQYQKEHRLDILMLDSSRETQERLNGKLIHNFQCQDVMTGREFMLCNSLPHAPWKYVFKKSIMIDNNVWFEENVNCEDVDWTHKLAFYAKKMQYKPVLLTHYVLLPASETGSEFKNINTICNRFFCGQRILSIRQLFSDDSEKNYLYNLAISTFCVGLRNMCGSFASPFQKYAIIKCYYIPNVNNNHRWFISFVAYHPLLFSILSTIIAPLARLYILLKREMRGR